jgi:signal transduction histidine kinase
MHRRALEGEILRADEDRWDRKCGTTTWVRWELRPWRTPNGIVGGILIFVEDITHRKQMEESILGMSRKLIESQEHERARIGRELHDDINQRLAMLAVDLEQLRENPSQVQSRVQELLKQTADLSDGVQALSHELHSSKLEYLGLVGGMKSWCTDFGQRQRMEIDFKHEVSSAVPHEVGLCLFRVLQEALHNAAKHSGVRHFEVRLRGTQRQIDLTISDLGVGFDKDTAMLSPGLGLTSMQERLKIVKGTLSIESQPKRGTTIRACVPLTMESDPISAVG